MYFSSLKRDNAGGGESGDRRRKNMIKTGKLGGLVQLLFTKFNYFNRSISFDKLILTCFFLEIL